MPSPSKAKGNRFERECVNIAKDYKIKSKRAYGSNGLSLGFTEDVDLLVGKYKVQCKCRKRIATWIKPPDSCDLTLVKEDRGEIYAIVRYSDFLTMIKGRK